jgi:transcription elongation factor Elf1
MTKGLKEQILFLRKQDKTYKEIVRELNCSLSVVSYHCSRNGLDDIGLKLLCISDAVIDKIKKYYLTHTLKETASKFNVSRATVIKYVENKRVVLSDEERKVRKIKSVSDRRRKVKKLAIDYKGGKCVRCGYNKYIGALEFHHTDSNEKDFNISKSGHSISWERVKKELDKCILVCSNCHAEIHEELRTRNYEI